MILVIYVYNTLSNFAQSPLSRLCCIRLSEFVIITLHYIRLSETIVQTERRLCEDNHGEKINVQQLLQDVV